MTALETIQAIRTLLDDNQSWFPILRGNNHATLFELINKAQQRVIEKYYALNDEKCLAPMTIVQTGLADGATCDSQTDAVTGHIFKLMYPRAVLVTLTDSNHPLLAQYVDYEMYRQYYINMAWNASAIMPVKLYYTLYRGWGSGGTQTKIYFNNNTNAKADIWYIPKPNPFFWDFNNSSNVLNYGLTVPPLYQFEVCCMVAEMINDMDVDEQFRGDPVYQNQKLDLKGLSDI